MVNKFDYTGGKIHTLKSDTIVKSLSLFRRCLDAENILRTVMNAIRYFEITSLIRKLEFN